MPWKPLSERYRTVKSVRYKNWVCVEGNNTSEARENYRKNPSYLDEDFILSRSPESDGYDIYIPTHITVFNN